MARTPAIGVLLAAREKAPVAAGVTLGRQVLIDGIQHDADFQVFAHDGHQGHCPLPSEVADHVGPELAADVVCAQQRPSEGDERGVRSGEPGQIPVVLDDVNDRSLETGLQGRGLVVRPFELLVDLARDEQRCELKVSCADEAAVAHRDA